MIWTKFFFKNDDAATGIVPFMCTSPNFFSLDNSLLYMDAPHKPAIYLRFTALVATIVNPAASNGIVYGLGIFLGTTIVIM